MTLDDVPDTIPVSEPEQDIPLPADTDTLSVPAGVTSVVTPLAATGVPEPDRSIEPSRALLDAVPPPSAASQLKRGPRVPEPQMSLASKPVGMGLLDRQPAASRLQQAPARIAAGAERVSPAVPIGQLPVGPRSEMFDPAQIPDLNKLFGPVDPTASLFSELSSINVRLAVIEDILRTQSGYHD